MKLTNKFNLPDGIYQRELKTLYRPEPDRLRVTELINPPLIKNLTMKHWDELEVDVSERLWSILGTAAHHVFEGETTEGIITEMRLNSHLYLPSDLAEAYKDDMLLLSGMVDRFDSITGTLSDYKVVGLWSFSQGLKPEWEQQLNIYRYLIETTTPYRVKRMEINAILRDWMQSKVNDYREPDYPECAFKSIDVPIWPRPKLFAFLKDRLTAHILKPMAECMAEEKWQRDTVYALHKKGTKRASRVLDTKQEMEQYIKENNFETAVERGQMYVQERVGMCVRCKSFCPVRTVCQFNKEGE